MAKVTFTPDSARRIADAVRRVESTPRDTAGSANPKPPRDPRCWGLIVGRDITGTRYHFLRVILDASADDPDAFLLGTEVGLRIVRDDTTLLLAREVNGHKGVDTLTVHEFSFVGYDKAGLPAFVFSSPELPTYLPLPPHDHRDNAFNNGGFCFSCFHPGTGIPSNPWGM